MNLRNILSTSYCQCLYNLQLPNSQIFCYTEDVNRLRIENLNYQSHIFDILEPVLQSIQRKIFCTPHDVNHLGIKVETAVSSQKCLTFFSAPHTRHKLFWAQGHEKCTRLVTFATRSIPSLAIPDGPHIV